MTNEPRTKATPAEMADIYLRAIDVLAERGWTQGYWEQDGKVCLDGALRVACGLQPRIAAGIRFGEREAALRWLDASGALAERLGMSLFFWNDADAESVEDVVLALKPAAYDIDEAAS